MQPTRPAPMSGGTRSRPKGVRRVRAQRSEPRSGALRPKGLALTAGGRPAPKHQRKFSQRLTKVREGSSPKAKTGRSRQGLERGSV